MAIAFLIGRIIFGGYFLLNSYNHLVHSGHMVGYAQSKGVPSARLAIVASGILLLIGGLSVVLGYCPLIGAIALIVFLVPVTFKMHDFWKIQDPMARMGERIAFEKNLALIGAALMMLAVSVPWPYSI